MACARRFKANGERMRSDRYGVAEMVAYARLFEWDDNHAKPPRQRVPAGSKPAAYAGAIIAVGAAEFVAQARFFERDDQPLQGQPR